MANSIANHPSSPGPTDDEERPIHDQAPSHRQPLRRCSSHDQTPSPRQPLRPWPSHDQTPPPRWPSTPLSETQSWSPQDYLDCAQRRNHDSPSPTMRRRIPEALQEHHATNPPRPVLPKPTGPALFGELSMRSSLPRIPALLAGPATRPTQAIPWSQARNTACTFNLTIVSFAFQPFYLLC